MKTTQTPVVKKTFAVFFLLSFISFTVYAQGDGP